MADVPLPVIHVYDKSMFIERPNGILEEVNVDRFERSPPPPSSLINPEQGLTAENTTRYQNNDISHGEGIIDLYDIEKILNHG